MSSLAAVKAHILKFNIMHHLSGPSPFANINQRLLTPLKCHVFENIMENGAFALLEQMLHFLKYFQKYSKLKGDGNPGDNNVYMKDLNKP